MVFFNLFACCLRLLPHAPESSFAITLSPLCPYCDPGSLALSRPEAIPVSAGVSRKIVHLFRWRSYFQKAFTGTKKTTSRERLPNPSLRRRIFTIQTPGSGMRRVTGRHRQSLTNHGPHFLILPPEPYGTCALGRPESAACHHRMIARRQPAFLRLWHTTRDRDTGDQSPSVMAPVLPLRCYATPYHR